MGLERGRVTLLVLVLMLAGIVLLSAGLSLSGRKPPAKPQSNVIPLTVRTPHAGFNRLVVSITVCEPRTTRCATIDDVMVDTGSTGLRLEASAVPTWLRLPAHVGPDQRPLAECLHFLHDDAWGPLYRADLRLGRMAIPDLPLQIISDDQRPPPAACPRSDVRPTSNGTLGIGPHLDDCPGACEQSATAPVYFIDHGGTWDPVLGSLDRAYRLPNPVSLLPDQNNGVVFDIPAPPDGGARELTGTLTFGVGTSTNNQPGTAQLVPVDGRGQFTTVYRGRAYPGSYIDSGTETYVLEGERLPRCAGMAWAFCSTPDLQLQAAMVGRFGVQVSFAVKIGDYRATLARGYGASDAMAVTADPGSTAFVWGAPFFLGKRVMVVLDGMAIPGIEGAAGPLYAIDDHSPRSPRP